jgi:hypothetical protein
MSVKHKHFNSIWQRQTQCKKIVFTLVTHTVTEFQVTKSQMIESQVTGSQLGSKMTSHQKYNVTEFLPFGIKSLGFKQSEFGCLKSL